MWQAAARIEGAGFGRGAAASGAICADALTTSMNEVASALKVTRKAVEEVRIRSHRSLSNPLSEHRYPNRGKRGTAFIRRRRGRPAVTRSGHLPQGWR
ncbi:hypothetical protein BRAO375_250010 [Bradyrhizobium sp. ORS 375]|nr:hypothetical protein BRAO375_250010 [Bradyrhizobium sp. ORS 375]